MLNVFVRIVLMRKVTHYIHIKIITMKNGLRVGIVGCVTEFVKFLGESSKFKWNINREYY